MCAGSIAAGIKERAEVGDALIVKTFQRRHFRSSPVNLKLFAPVNDPACPVCINFGSRLVSVAKLVKKASAQCGGLGVSTVAGACVRGCRKKLSKRDGRDVVMSRTCRNR